MLSTALCTGSLEAEPSSVTIARHSAVVELGSTFRLVVTDPWTRRVTARVEAPVDLGASCDRLGVIEDAYWASALHAAGALAARGRTLATAGLAAVATGPARDALNGASLIEAVSTLHGLPVEVLDAEREAALVYRAAMRGQDSGRGLLVLPGPSSVELVFGRGARPDRIESLPFGTASLQELLGGHSGAVSLAARRQIDAYVKSALSPLAARCTFAGPYPVVLAGRAITALAPLVGDEPGRMTVTEVRALAMALEGLSSRDVGRLTGETFAAAAWTATLVTSLLVGLGASSARVSSAAACDGLVAGLPQNPTRRWTRTPVGT